MSVDFSNVSSLVIPEGEITMILSGDTVLWQKQKLPMMYQEVEYISATYANGAYIDLGITYDKGCSWEIQLVYRGTADYFGVFQNDSKRARLDVGAASVYFNVGMDADNTVFANIAALTVVGESYILKGKAINTNVQIENATTGELRNESVTVDKVQYTCTYNMYLMGLHYKGAGRTNGIRTVKHFRYWDKDDNLLRDMIPCYHRSDNVIGMYDLVTQTFFTNAGTGSFTVGAAV